MTQLDSLRVVSVLFSLTRISYFPFTNTVMRRCKLGVCHLSLDIFPYKGANPEFETHCSETLTKVNEFVFLYCWHSPALSTCIIFISLIRIREELHKRGGYSKRRKNAFHAISYTVSQKTQCRMLTSLFREPCLSPNRTSTKEHAKKYCLQAG